MIKEFEKRLFKKVVTKIKKESSNEITACCPLCGDTKNRLHLYDSKFDKALVYCYNAGCEASDAPITLLSFLYKSNGDVQAYKRESLQTKVQEIKNHDYLLDKIKAKVPEPAKTNQPEIPLGTLFKRCKDVPECREYIKSRNITMKDDWFFSDKKFFTYNSKNVYLLNYLLIPIYNKDFKYRGFYSRSIEEKRFSTFLLPDTEKLWLQHPTEQPEIITEGIFDALCTGYENPGAMLGADLSPEYLRTLPKNTIFAFDNDTTGLEKSLKYQKMGFDVFVWPELNEKDFNEMIAVGYTAEGIKYMIEKNVYRGKLAEARLLMKPR